MGYATLEVADREQTATRLLDASAEHSFDPMVEIDWDAPLLDDTFFLPPHRVSLYGTALWETMSRQQRIDLSRHEVASMASVGIWFELVLMQMLIRHAYDRAPNSAHVQYALTEVGDECRHSVMFGRMVDKLGCPAYGPGRLPHELARILKTISFGAETFAAALIAEEILDRFQREAMKDDDIQPLVRDVSRIHVIEESRHMRYAREEVVRQVRDLNAVQLAMVRMVVARAGQVIGTQLINPRVYAAVGLDPKAARKVAAANPHHRETMRWAAERLTSFFEDVRLMSRPARMLWRRAGLIA